MRRRGFTILELLVSIAILAILVGLVANQVSGAYWNARKRRMESIQLMIQTAIETYNLRHGRWPGKLEDYATKASDEAYRVLTYAESDDVFCTLLKGSCSKSRSPYLDPSSMFVAKKTIEHDSWKRKGGMDFAVAVRKKIPPSQLTLGYPTFGRANFHRFVIVYFPRTDTVKVMHCCRDCCTDGKGTAGTCIEEQGAGLNGKCPNRCHDW